MRPAAACDSASPVSRKGTRHELKFVLPSERVAAVREWLHHLCAPDPAFRHNVIHSLYFDTPALASLNEKIQSEFQKCKLRARWYTDESGQSVSEQAFLEIKRKEGHRSFKCRHPLPVDTRLLQANPLEVGCRLDLPALVPEAEYVRIRAMLPFCVIRYLRNRYIDMESGFRISLDHGIGITHANDRFQLPGGPGRLNAAVLEVKGPGATGLPPRLRELAAFDLVKTSFSKYAECVNHLLLRKG